MNLKVKVYQFHPYLIPIYLSYQELPFCKAVVIQSVEKIFIKKKDDGEGSIVNLLGDKKVSQLMSEYLGQ